MGLELHPGEPRRVGAEEELQQAGSRSSDEVPVGDERQSASAARPVSVSE